MRNYENQFADYDDPRIAQFMPIAKRLGWQDTSWGNDICPSIETQFLLGGISYRYRIWLDYSNPDAREIGGAQFALDQYNPENDEFENMPFVIQDGNWLGLLCWIEANSPPVAFYY